MNQLKIRAICDGCQMSIFEATFSCKCQSCEDFDLCGNCADCVPHNPDHQFRAITPLNNSPSLKIEQIAWLFYQMHYAEFSKDALVKLSTATRNILNNSEFKKSPKEFVRRWVASRGGEEVFLYFEDPCLDFFCLYARIQREEHCNDEDGFTQEFYQFLCQNF